MNPANTRILLHRRLAAATGASKSSRIPCLFFVMLLFGLVPAFVLFSQNLISITNEESIDQQRSRSIFEVDESRSPNILPTPWTDALKINSINNIPVLDFRVVHLDLKGAPPKVNFLAEVFPIIKAAGANAVLIEYEDMFPYETPIKEASAYNSYTRSEIETLLSLAESNELEIIPLVQTFGHLEHLLKNEQFSYLREDSRYPESLCPTQNDSQKIIRAMLDQVMDIHMGRIKYIHIGCDEVYHLASCSRCIERLKRFDNKESLKPHNIKLREHLFLDHVYSVAKYVKDKYSIQPLMWDDMLRMISFKDLENSRISDVVEPVVWVYGENVDELLGRQIWQHYFDIFDHVWAASAFKGAFGERLLVPDVKRHVKNNQDWLKIISRESTSDSSPESASRFRGIILTGWSRYDHFAVLCELLPTSMASLIINLLVVSGHEKTNKRFDRLAHKHLRCPFKLNSVFSSDTNGYQIYPYLRRCRFLGHEVFSTAIELRQLKETLEASEVKLRLKEGWMSRFNLKMNSTSTWRLEEPLKSYQEFSESLASLESRMKKLLLNIYEKPTVLEWTEQNLDPLKLQINQTLFDIQNMRKRTAWPRRPFAKES